jgi:hypothetical protein
LDERQEPLCVVGEPCGVEAVPQTVEIEREHLHGAFCITHL